MEKINNYGKAINIENANNLKFTKNTISNHTQNNGNTININKTVDTLISINFFIIFSSFIDLLFVRFQL